MKYAHIINNTVINVSYDPANSFAEELAQQFVEIPEIVDIHWHLLNDIDENGQLLETKSWVNPLTYLETYEEGDPPETKYRRVERSMPAPVIEINPDHFKLTKFAFRNRFTATEKAAIEFAALDNPTADTQARMFSAALRATLADQRDATYIDLLRQDTQEGVRLLETNLLLGPGRADEILTIPGAEHERFIIS